MVISSFFPASMRHSTISFVFFLSLSIFQLITSRVATPSHVHARRTLVEGLERFSGETNIDKDLIDTAAGTDFQYPASHIEPKNFAGNRKIDVISQKEAHPPGPVDPPPNEGKDLEVDQGQLEAERMAEAKFLSDRLTHYERFVLLKMKRDGPDLKNDKKSLMKWWFFASGRMGKALPRFYPSIADSVVDFVTSFGLSKVSADYHDALNEVFKNVLQGHMYVLPENWDEMIQGVAGALAIRRNKDLEEIFKSIPNFDGIFKTAGSDIMAQAKLQKKGNIDSIGLKGVNYLDSTPERVIAAEGLAILSSPRHDARNPLYGFWSLWRDFLDELAKVGARKEVVRSYVKQMIRAGAFTDVKKLLPELMDPDQALSSGNLMSDIKNSHEQSFEQAKQVNAHTDNDPMPAVQNLEHSEVKQLLPELMAPDQALSPGNLMSDIKNSHEQSFERAEQVNAHTVPDDDPMPAVQDLELSKQQALRDVYADAWLFSDAVLDAPDRRADVAFRLDYWLNPIIQCRTNKGLKDFAEPLADVLVLALENVYSKEHPYVEWFANPRPDIPSALLRNTLGTFFDTHNFLEQKKLTLLEEIGNSLRSHPSSHRLVWTYPALKNNQVFIEAVRA